MVIQGLSYLVTVTMESIAEESSLYNKTKMK